MIAVISTGGKQYTVSEGDILRVEKLQTEAGKIISFDQVLLVSKPDGSGVKVGAPTVSGASVTGKVRAQGRARKVEVRKFKAKSRYAKTYGHRQPYTEIEITKIAA